MTTAIEHFQNSLKAICPEMTEDEFKLFESKLSIEDFEKKSVYLEAGEVQKSIGYISKGLVRSYYIDQEGNEITVGFYAEGSYATHFSTYLSRKPSLYTIQCIEPTSMLSLKHDDHLWLYEQASAFERYGRLITEAILIQQQERIESFIFESAEKRYLDFIEKNKSLFNRVSLSHLCSYLGIERQSLTRIRHKLASK